MKDPTRLGYQNLLEQVVGGLRCIGSLTINKNMESLLYCQVYEPLCKFDPMQSQGQDKCLSLYLNSLMPLYLVLLQSNKPYGNSLKVHFLLPYDALNGSFVEQCVFILIGTLNLCK
jgi:hypothetical protein